jgi:hypothetical protein
MAKLLARSGMPLPGWRAPQDVTARRKGQQSCLIYIKDLI